MYHIITTTITYFIQRFYNWKHSLTYSHINRSAQANYILNNFFFLIKTTWRQDDATFRMFFILNWRQNKKALLKFSVPRGRYIVVFQLSV